MKMVCLFVVGAIVVLLSGCGGATKDDSSMLKNLSNKEKSVILSDKGIRMYKEMISKNDLTMLPNVRNTFQESLQYDALNKDATVYQAKVNKFSSDAVAKNISAAKISLDKKQRTDNDDYTLCINIQKAYKIDPSNKDVLALRDSTTNIREKYAAKALAEGDSNLTLAKKDTNKTTQENEVMASITSLDKGLAIGSVQEKALASKRGDAVTLLSGIMDFRIAETKKLILINNFKDSETAVKKLNKENGMANHKMNDALSKLQYDLYFAWAGNLFKSGKIDLASDKIDLAVAQKQTDEAKKLKTQIQNKKEKADVSGSFNNWLSDIDDLIAQKEYALAVQRIKAIEPRVKEADKKKMLLDRSGRMKDQIDVVYKDAVDDFVNENYSEAAKGFQNTLAVDPGYKDAKNYLDEARAKEKIMKSY